MAELGRAHLLLVHIIRVATWWISLRVQARALDISHTCWHKYYFEVSEHVFASTLIVTGMRTKPSPVLWSHHEYVIECIPQEFFRP